MAGDNSPLSKEESHSFHLDAQAACPFTVQIEGKNSAILAVADFTKDVTYNKGEELQLYIRDAEGGGITITDE
jgi:hypothetical protein